MSDGQLYLFSASRIAAAWHAPLTARPQLPDPSSVAEWQDRHWRSPSPCVSEAACSLGRLGRPEGAQSLKQALRLAPSSQVIEAVPPVADEECVVLLGRIARGSSQGLDVAACASLDAVEHPLAARLLERLSA